MPAKGSGTADYLRQAIADQAPAAIKWLKHVVSESPDNMAWVPSSLNNEAERVRYADNIDMFTLKERHSAATVSFSHLFGDDFEEAMLKDDLRSYSHVKAKIPKSYVVHCIQRHFQGQRYRQGNEDDYLSALKQLGLLAKPADILSKSKYCVIFPSNQGIRHLLRKKQWLGDDHSDIDV